MMIVKLNNICVEYNIKKTTITFGLKMKLKV